MIAILSPAKSLNLDPSQIDFHSQARFEKEAFALSKILRRLKSTELMKLMDISEALATENLRRYKNFKRRHDLLNSKQALFTFAGDVYRGIEVADFDKEDISFAQEHIRILSGMYGLLRPMDLIQAYRLEMGSSMANSKGKNLYEFWGEQITKELNNDFKKLGSEVLINVASNEYFKAVKPKKLKARIIDIQFKEYRNGKLSFLSFNAKKARGLFARYMVKNRIVLEEDLKGFNYESYGFEEKLSSERDWLFVR